MSLTDVQIRGLKPRDKAYMVADGHGLSVEVSTAGTKTFRLRYRLDGKPTKMSLGEWPGLSLSQARDKARELRELVKSGRNPVSERKAERSTAAANRAATFGAVAREYLKLRLKENLSPRTTRKNDYLIRLALTDLEHRPISEISTSELMTVLQRVDALGIRKTALRLRGSMGQVFRFAVQTGRAEHDPTQALRGAIKPEPTKHRAAILDTKRLGALLRAIDGYNAVTHTDIALELIIHTFVRPGELRHAKWEDVNFHERVWRIPAGRTKMKRELLVPLSPQALATFRRLSGLTGNYELCFPGMRVPARPISNATLNAALRALGFPKEEVCAHGFRATASSILNESRKFTADAIERQLGHVPKNQVRAAYNRSEFWPERVELMNWYSDRLDLLKAGGDLLPFRSRDTQSA